MINVFLGRAGRLWPEAVRLVQNARRDGARVLLLVPQQYTLQTERQLMDALGSGGFFDVDVLSPLRFTQRVFAQAGGDDRTRIDARGKAMAVAGALLKCRRSLKYYESAVERQGLIERVGTLIADFKRAGVSCDALSDYAQALPQGAARDKFSDLALIYAAYEKMLSGQFADGEDVDALLAGRVASAELMMGAKRCRGSTCTRRFHRRKKHCICPMRRRCRTARRSGRMRFCGRFARALKRWSRRAA